MAISFSPYAMPSDLENDPRERTIMALVDEVQSLRKHFIDLENKVTLSERTQTQEITEQESLTRGKKPLR
jgi:hypothetical protein